MMVAGGMMTRKGIGNFPEEEIMIEEGSTYVYA